MFGESSPRPLSLGSACCAVLRGSTDTNSQQRWAPFLFQVRVVFVPSFCDSTIASFSAFDCVMHACTGKVRNRARVWKIGSAAVDRHARADTPLRRRGAVHAGAVTYRRWRWVAPRRRRGAGRPRGRHRVEPSACCRVAAREHRNATDRRLVRAAAHGTPARGRCTGTHRARQIRRDFYKIEQTIRRSDHWCRGNG